METTKQNATSTSHIKVDSKTAIEASQAIAKSDKKEQTKKVDIASNEHTFLTWFMLQLQKMLDATKTVHGQCMELKPYMILFDALKKQGYSLARFGALDKTGISKQMNYVTLFPCHVEGKTKLVSDGVVYHAIKNSKDFKVFSNDKKRYMHYVNNCFYVFHVPTALDKQQEVVELKKLSAQQAVEKEKEKAVVDTVAKAGIKVAAVVK